MSLARCCGKKSRSKTVRSGRVNAHCRPGGPSGGQPFLTDDMTSDPSAPDRYRYGPLFHRHVMGATHSTRPLITLPTVRRHGRQGVGRFAVADRMPARCQSLAVPHRTPTYLACSQTCTTIHCEAPPSGHAGAVDVPG
jgi:hypothetical protein